MFYHYNLKIMGTLCEVSQNCYFLENKFVNFVKCHIYRGQSETLLAGHKCFREQTRLERVYFIIEQSDFPLTFLVVH
jgi:hypothetical protein